MQHRGVCLSAMLLLLALACAPNTADPRRYQATLAGHAVMPALPLIDPPADAPVSLHSSGRWLADSGGTGEAPAFDGQPLHGHSGITRAPDGTYWMLTDNGAGLRSNSADFMLYLTRYRVDFDSGSFVRLETVFISDPSAEVPFRIVTAGTEPRYLTGADFDPESMQFARGSIWIAEEFGPYLIKLDRRGHVLAVHETWAGGKRVVSPDSPSARGAAGSLHVATSKGFEGLAVSPDESKLYAMLEGPLSERTTGPVESEDGRPYVRILEFDVQAESWTGRYWKYLLEHPRNAVGDFSLIDATSALVIERDDYEGAQAAFKRVYKIRMDEDHAGLAVPKIGYVDLMSIADPGALARKPLNNGSFAMPFATVETVAQVDDLHIVVGNDNNLSRTRGRDPQLGDDSELALLEVGSLLNAG